MNSEWEMDKRFIRAIADVEIATGAPKFLNWPDRWFESWTVRCENGHISKRILKTDEGDRCLACRGRTHMTFPEDVETSPPSHFVVE